MRDGSTEGMQCFDDEIEKLIRAGVLDMDTGMAYATNEGNLRLLLADMSDPQQNLGATGAADPEMSQLETEEVIER